MQRMVLSLSLEVDWPEHAVHYPPLPSANVKVCVVLYLHYLIYIHGPVVKHQIYVYLLPCIVQDVDMGLY